MDAKTAMNANIDAWIDDAKTCVRRGYDLPGALVDQTDQ